jgi:sec-independent protein translocase protein TatA
MRIYSYTGRKTGGDLYMLSGIGTTEIVVMALVLLVLFGGKKLPELARGVGDSIREFRKAANEKA